MKILWIEDFGGKVEPSKLAIDMFEEFLPTTVFRKEYDRYEELETQLPRLFKKHTFHHLDMCKSYLEWQKTFKTNHDSDIALIDINLNRYPTPLEKMPKGLDNPEFDTRAGFYIYHQLIKTGFPDENIAFFTGNGDKLPDFERYCNAILIEKPTYTFVKETADYERLRKWLAVKADDAYLRLRRGIIEGCQLLKDELHKLDPSLLEQRLLFYKTTPLPRQVAESPETYRDYVSEYLTKLESFFPLNPTNKQQLYRPFLKELVADWEMSRGYFNDPSMIPCASDSERHFYQMCQSQMKLLRNWSAHQLIPMALTEKEIAYDFMLAMRSWLHLDIGQIYPYERILAGLFRAPEETEFENQLKQHLTYALKTSYYELRQELYKQDKYINPRGNKFGELMGCLGDLAKSKSQLKHDIPEKWATKLLYQSFWHGLASAELTIKRPSIDVSKPGVAMFINFTWKIMPKELFPYFIGKLIFKESF